MSICGNCNARVERPCTYEARTKEYFDVIIKAVRHRAYRCGYAIAVHGSLKTDIDLIACPWRESCVDAAYLAEEVRSLVEAIIGFCEPRKHDKERLPEKKPCGRLAWSFYLQPEGCAPGPYIDLSVMPQGAREPEPTKKSRRK